jgi:hypothetical protein
MTKKESSGQHFAGGIIPVRLGKTLPILLLPHAFP